MSADSSLQDGAERTRKANPGRDRKDWNLGFCAGVLSALSCVAAVDGPNSVLYDEIVIACGAQELLREAVREDDDHARYIRKTIADARRRAIGGKV